MKTGRFLAHIIYIEAKLTRCLCQILQELSRTIALKENISCISSHQFLWTRTWKIQNRQFKMQSHFLFKCLQKTEGWLLGMIPLNKFLSCPHCLIVRYIIIQMYFVRKTREASGSMLFKNERGMRRETQAHKAISVVLLPSVAVEQTTQNVVA